MALPKIDVPIHELTLPILNKKIRYRPFLVKEQKILLMASESSDSETIERSIRQVLQNCCLDNVDVSELSLLDVEYYFMHIRAVSVGEIVENKFRCQNIVDEIVCNNTMDVKLDLTKIKIVGLESYNDTIAITDKIGVKMTLPKYSVLEKMKDRTEGVSFIFELIANCVEYVYENDQIHYTKDLTHEEVIEFLESLNQEQFENIQKFFELIPKLEKKTEVTCNKCGFHHTIEFEGIESFFE